MSDNWTLRDEIEAAETRLVYFCHEVEAGRRQGGGREFLRQIDASFRSIRKMMREQGEKS